MRPLVALMSPLMILAYLFTVTVYDVPVQLTLGTVRQVKQAVTYGRNKGLLNLDAQIVAAVCALPRDEIGLYCREVDNM